jgi:hypothetical protein
MAPSSREILIDIPHSRVRATQVEDESERSFDFRHEENNTKDQLLQLQSELQRLPSLKHPTDLTNTYTLIDCEGVPHEVEVPSLFLGLNGCAYVVRYRNVFQRDLKDKSRHQHYEPWGVDVPNIRCAAYIGIEHILPATSYPINIQERHDKWQESDTKRVLKEFFDEHKDHLPTVTKVVGTGLGNPGSLLEGSESYEDTEAASYFRHLALIHLAKRFGKDVEIYVQDLYYSPATERLFAVMGKNYKCKIHIVKEPEAFCMVDDKTFLVTGHTGFDMVDIALEVAGDKGLAGWLGHLIWQDHQELLEETQVYTDVPLTNFASLTSTRKFNFEKNCEPLLRDEIKEWFGTNHYLYLNLKK